ncbi:MAG: hypothetical protein ACTSXZ_08450 [Alphaproteobacteria bacterium]
MQTTVGGTQTIAPPSMRTAMKSSVSGSGINRISDLVIAPSFRRYVQSHTLAALPPTINNPLIFFGKDGGRGWD